MIQITNFEDIIAKLILEEEQKLTKIKEKIECNNKNNMEELIYGMNKIFVKTEEDLTILIVIPVPGLTKEDVGVTIVEDKIVVSVSKSNEFVSKYQIRTIPLPKKASTEDVQSIVKDGMLTIKFSKKQEYLPQHLVVE